MMTNELVHTMVTDVMTPYLITVDQYATLAEAYEIMLKNRIRRIPVTKNERLIGIVTMKDILEAKPSDVHHSLNKDEINELLSTIIVEQVMSHDPVKVFQTDTIGHAAELMLDKKVGGLPVIDANKKLVGLITESDIFRTIVKKWRDDNILNAGI